MQDQGKRLLIAVALALGVLFAWNAIFHKEEPPPPDKAGSAATKSAEPAGTTGAKPGAKPVEDQPRPAQEMITLRYDSFVATFSSYCGGLKSWQLTDARYARDATHGRLLPEKSQLTTSDANGNPIPVPPEQMVNVPDCGAFDVNFALSTFVVPHHAVWKGEQRGPNEVVYTSSNAQLDLVKTFTVFPDKYLVRMAVKVGVRVAEGTEARQQLVVSVYSYQDPAKAKGGSTRVAPRVWASSTMREGSIVETDVVSLIETRRYEPAIQWTGFEHPYLLVGYAPRIAE